MSYECHPSEFHVVHYFSMLGPAEISGALASAPHSIAVWKEAVHDWPLLVFQDPLVGVLETARHSVLSCYQTRLRIEVSSARTVIFLTYFINVRGTCLTVVFFLNEYLILLNATRIHLFSFIYTYLLLISLSPQFYFFRRMALIYFGSYSSSIYTYLKIK